MKYNKVLYKPEKIESSNCKNRIFSFKYIVGILLFCVVIFFIILILVNNHYINSLKIFLTKDDVGKVVVIYNENNTKCLPQWEKVDLEITKYINNLEANYLDGRLDSKTAENRLLKLSEIENTEISEYAIQTKNNINLYENSKEKDYSSSSDEAEIIVQESTTETVEISKKEREDSYEVQPVSLSDLEIFYIDEKESDSGSIIEIGDWDSYKKDSLGNTGYNGIYFWLQGTEGESSVEYLLEKKYNVLKGYFTLADSARDRDEVFMLNFYGDGDLIYSSSELTGGVIPFDIEVDVSGKNKLTIECIGKNGSPGNYWGYAIAGFVNGELL